MLYPEQKWFLGDEEAVAFAGKLWQAAQIWDDIIDEGDTSQTNDLIQWLVWGVHLDPFYQRYEAWLKPAMLQMYLQWRDANVLERGTAEDVEKAWMLRAGVWGVFGLIAWLVGGEEHSKTVGPEIWRGYGETKQNILKEFGQCHSQQQPS